MSQSTPKSLRTLLGAFEYVERTRPEADMQSPDNPTDDTLALLNRVGELVAHDESLHFAHCRFCTKERADK